MRLIRTTKLDLEEFVDDQIPKYAILSHRWEAGEVSMQDWVEERQRGSAGDLKVRAFCDLAVQHGYDYAWVDTCCIDKRNSAELSEAVNSMFEWYRRAGVCMVYLSDVSMEELDVGKDPDEVDMKEFRQSAWFTRGWTLQELLAPDHSFFYSKSWKQIGTRRSLLRHIVEASGIEERYITATPAFARNLEQMLASTTIAMRISWASRRRTTRIEDAAYCLLGLFGISMMPLYGEGHRAFRRLQLEIMKEFNDDSLFAWSTNSARLNNFLATHPRDFATAPAMLAHSWHPFSRGDFVATNAGIKLTASLLPAKTPSSSYPGGLKLGNKNFRYLLLNCTNEAATSHLALIVLPAVTEGEGRKTLWLRRSRRPVWIASHHIPPAGPQWTTSLDDDTAFCRQTIYLCENARFAAAAVAALPERQ